MSRPSYVATAGGFCMAGSSRPATPVSTASTTSKPVAEAVQPILATQPKATTQRIK